MQHTLDCPHSLLNVLRRELTETHVQNLQLQDPMVRALLHSPVKRLSSRNELLSRELFLLNTMVRKDIPFCLPRSNHLIVQRLRSYFQCTFLSTSDHFS
jgi:hypothetical protein